MTITSGQFTLSPAQRQFKVMLDLHPKLVSYWDFEIRECDIDSLRKALGVLSHGEAIIARFLVAVWLGENRLNFDLIEATKSLDGEQLQVFTDWLSNPAFP